MKRSRFGLASIFGLALFLSHAAWAGFIEITHQSGTTGQSIQLVCNNSVVALIPPNSTQQISYFTIYSLSDSLVQSCQLVETGLSGRQIQFKLEFSPPRNSGIATAVLSRQFNTAGCYEIVGGKTPSNRIDVTRLKTCNNLVLF